jgi:hypothetical protein
MECLQKKDASNDMVLSFHMFSDVVVELAPSIPRMVSSVEQEIILASNH